jgi:hypothetical protein
VRGKRDSLRDRPRKKTERMCVRERERKKEDSLDVCVSERDRQKAHHLKKQIESHSSLVMQE